MMTQKKVLEGSGEVQSITNGIDNTFWETLYFAYCIKLGRSEEEFFNSTIGKVTRILEINMKGIEKNEDVTVTSMRDFLK